MILTGTGIIDSAKSSSALVEWVIGGVPFSAASTNKIAWSPDGINWVKGTITDNANITNIWAVAYNGTIWVAVGEGTNKLMTSTDGKNWTTSNALNTFFTIARGVAWNGSVFLVTGVRINTTGSAVASSANGITWTSNGGTLLGNTTNTGNFIYWTGSRWYMMGQYTSGSALFKIVTTTVSNGLSGWSGVTVPNELLYAGGNSIAYNGTTTYVVSGGNGVQTTPPYYSLGYSTTNPASSFTTLPGFQQMGIGSTMWSNYGPGRFVANGASTTGNSSIQFSNDGINWTNSANSNAIFGNTKSTAYPTKIAYNGTYFLAGGGGGTYKLGYSFDADTWYGLTSPFGSTQVQAIASRIAPSLYPPLS